MELSTCSAGTSWGWMRFGEYVAFAKPCRGAAGWLFFRLPGALMNAWPGRRLLSNPPSTPPRQLRELGLCTAHSSIAGRLPVRHLPEPQCSSDGINSPAIDTLPSARHASYSKAQVLREPIQISSLGRSRKAGILLVGRHRINGPAVVCCGAANPKVLWNQAAAEDSHDVSE